MCGSEILRRNNFISTSYFFVSDCFLCLFADVVRLSFSQCLNPGIEVRYVRGLEVRRRNNFVSTGLN